jgi:hypothetical protein
MGTPNWTRSFEYQVLGGNLDLVEGDGRRVRCSLAELVLLLVDCHPRQIAVDDEGADPAMTGLRIGLRVDRVPGGVAAVGDEALRP